MDNKLIENLIRMQYGLNEYITPKWVKNRTELDFMIASHQEVSELIDTSVEVDGKKHSLNWKWWKDAKGGRTTDSIDWNSLHSNVKDNIYIELTDLLFFTLSQQLLNDNTHEGEVMDLNDNDWVNILAITANNLLQRPGAALQLILQMSDKLGFNISAYYIAKHTLNFIRQLNGYKDGSYKKTVDGIEDNELLHQTIADVTPEMMVHDFENISNIIMAKVYDIFGIPAEVRADVAYWMNFTK